MVLGLLSLDVQTPTDALGSQSNDEARLVGVDRHAVLAEKAKRLLHAMANELKVPCRFNLPMQMLVIRENC